MKVVDERVAQRGLSTWEYCTCLENLFVNTRHISNNDYYSAQVEKNFFQVQCAICRIVGNSYFQADVLVVGTW